MRTTAVDLDVLTGTSTWQVLVSGLVSGDQRGERALGSCLATQEDPIRSNPYSLAGGLETSYAEAAYLAQHCGLDVNLGTGDLLGICDDRGLATHWPTPPDTSSPRVSTTRGYLTADALLHLAARRLAQPFLWEGYLHLETTRLLDWLTEEIVRFPVPVFGSPPSGWQQLKTVISAPVSLIATGALVGTSHHAMAVVTAGGTFVLWFAKPTGEVLRQDLAERVARAVGATPPHESTRDERDL